MILAGAAHARVLAALHEAAFPHEPWNEAGLLALLAQPGMVALLDERGGFVLLRLVLDEAEIITIGVGQPRQGIGRDLLRAGLALAARRGVRRVHLEVAEDNEPALALYAAAGFQRNGRRRAYYADGGDALTMHLDLAGEEWS